MLLMLARMTLSFSMRTKLSIPTQRASLKPSHRKNESRTAVKAGKYMKISRKITVGTRNK